jgi:hypothetical protein
VRSKIENRFEYVMHMLLGDRTEAEKRVPGGAADGRD